MIALAMVSASGAIAIAAGVLLVLGVLRRVGRLVRSAGGGRPDSEGRSAQQVKRLQKLEVRRG